MWNGTVTGQSAINTAQCSTAADRASFHTGMCWDCTGYWKNWLKNFLIYCLKAALAAEAGLMPECFITCRRYGAAIPQTPLKGWVSSMGLLLDILFLQWEPTSQWFQIIKPDGWHRFPREDVWRWQERSAMNWILTSWRRKKKRKYKSKSVYLKSIITWYSMAIIIGYPVRWKAHVRYGRLQTRLAGRHWSVPYIIMCRQTLYRSG